jgi:hypothetical protein
VQIPLGTAIPFAPVITKNQTIDPNQLERIIVRTVAGPVGLFEIHFSVVPEDSAQLAIRIGGRQDIPQPQKFGSSTNGQNFVPTVGSTIAKISDGSFIEIIANGPSLPAQQINSIPSLGGAELAPVGSLTIKQVGVIKNNECRIIVEKKKERDNDKKKVGHLFVIFFVRIGLRFHRCLFISPLQYIEKKLLRYSKLRCFPNFLASVDSLPKSVSPRDPPK